MNANALLSFLLTLSVRRRLFTSTSPWRFRLETFAFSTILHLWRIYKSAYRIITGQGAIERLCNSAPPTQTLRIDEKRFELEGRELKNIVWRIEFRLSAQLTEEYITILDIARAQSENDDVCSSELSTVAGEIASVVQHKKKMSSACLPFLGDTITCLILIETGKQRLIRQSNEAVTSSVHKDLLNEIWLAVIIPERPASDSPSELTLVDEKEYGKETVDWVKLGFQGKSPQTDFRATGALGLKQFHSFCTTYPVLARRIVAESGSSQALQISEPWYPFALVGIHVTRTIIETLSAGLLHEDIILKAHGNLVQSVDRTCQDIYGAPNKTLYLIADRLVEEFHLHWMGLVKIGIVKSVFDFERVYRDFKRSKGML